MNSRMNYARLQLKRSFRSFPKIFLMSLLIFCMASALFYAKFSSSSSKSDYSKIKIGLVENNEGKYFQMGIYALEHMDNFRFSVDFTQLSSEEEAEKMLYSGEINLYAVIPQRLHRFNHIWKKQDYKSRFGKHTGRTWHKDSH